jgi:hypothetical protein
MIRDRLPKWVPLPEHYEGLGLPTGYVVQEPVSKKR